MSKLQAYFDRRVKELNAEILHKDAAALEMLLKNKEETKEKLSNEIAEAINLPELQAELKGILASASAKDKIKMPAKEGFFATLRVTDILYFHSLTVNPDKSPKKTMDTMKQALFARLRQDLLEPLVEMAALTRVIADIGYLQRKKQFSIVEPVNYGINLTVVAEYSAIVQRFEVEYNKGLRQQKANEMNAPWSFSALAQAFGYRKSEGGNAKSDSNDQIIDNQSVFQL